MVSNMVDSSRLDCQIEAVQVERPFLDRPGVWMGPQVGFEFRLQLGAPVDDLVLRAHRQRPAQESSRPSSKPQLRNLRPLVHDPAMLFQPGDHLIDGLLGVYRLGHLGGCGPAIRVFLDNHAPGCLSQIDAGDGWDLVAHDGILVSITALHSRLSTHSSSPVCTNPWNRASTATRPPTAAAPPPPRPTATPGGGGSRYIPEASTVRRMRP